VFLSDISRCPEYVLNTTMAKEHGRTFVKTKIFYTREIHSW